MSSDDDATTKPTIETVLARINELGERQATETAALRQLLEETRAEMRERFDKLEGHVKLLDKKIDKLALDILEVRAEQGMLEDRVDKLERKPS